MEIFTLLVKINRMKYLFYFSGLCTLLLCLSFNRYPSQVYQEKSEGKKLFHSNCSPCHSLVKGEKLFGPPLFGRVKKNNEKWVFAHLVDHRLQINNKDKKAVKLYEEYKNSIHPSFENLTSSQLKEIISYLKTIN